MRRRRLGDELGGLQQCRAERGRDLHPERNQDAGSGDRVVVKTRDGEVMAKELRRSTAKAIELKSLNAQHPDRTIATEDVLWVARILWASQ